MDRYLQDEPSPWDTEGGQSSTFGLSLNVDDHEASPWAQPDEDDERGPESPSLDPYSSVADPITPMGASRFNATEEESSDVAHLLGAPQASQGLGYIERSPESPAKLSTPKVAVSGGSPSRTRRTRLTRDKKEAVSVESVSGELVDPLGVGSEPRAIGKSGKLGDPPSQLSESLADVSLDAEDPVRQALGGHGSRSSGLGFGNGGQLSNADDNESNQTAGDVDSLPNVNSDSEDELPGTITVEVGDPVKVGELTAAHTVYTINTTASDVAAYPANSSVTRRYRDFRWLYRALVHNNSGYIVPPPPEKQAVGRFNNEFVEYRRTALDQMLKKIVKHAALRIDPDLVAFLTHDSFADYVKSRVVSDEELEAAGGGSGSGSGAGLIASIGGVLLGKSEEPDSWLQEKRLELDALELQLRELFKALDILHNQRKEMADSLAEFANVTDALAGVEPTRKLGTVLREFARVHAALSEQYQRQRQQDSVFLESTVDENLRLVNSIRDAYSSRQRAQSVALASQADYEKKLSFLEKVQKQGKSQQDRIRGMESEVEQARERAAQHEETARTVSRTVEAELSRIDREKVHDFRNSVEVFLENAVEAQKQAIELWETFYSRFFAASDAAA